VACARYTSSVVTHTYSECVFIGFQCNFKDNASEVTLSLMIGYCECRLSQTSSTGSLLFTFSLDTIENGIRSTV